MNLTANDLTVIALVVSAFIVMACCDDPRAIQWIRDQLRGNR